MQYIVKGKMVGDYPFLTKRVAVPLALTGDLLEKKSSVAYGDSPFVKGAWCGYA
jgi:hypothetical protein